MLIRSLGICLVFACVSGTLASVQDGMTTPMRHVIYFRNQEPVHWVLSHRALPQQVVTFRIALRQQNLDILEELFWNVSDPDSPQYKNYMEIHEIASLVEPPQPVKNLILVWLGAAGVFPTDIDVQYDAIAVQATVEVVEKLFLTTMYEFVSESWGSTIIRQMGEYSLPISIHPHVEMVTGISDFPMPRPSSSKNILPQTADPNVIPRTITSMYNISSDLIGDATLSSQCAVEFQGDSSFDPKDLSTFFDETSARVSKFDHIIGPFDSSFPDTEASLDVEYLASIGVGMDNWYWTEEQWMYDFANKFFSTDVVPLVLSISWGWSEMGQCPIDTNLCSQLGIDSATYVTRTNVEFMKIGLRGVTIVVASGDSGANGRVDGDCSGKQLNAIFPGGSPYVTTVGATQLANPSTTMPNPPEACAKTPCAIDGEEVAVSYPVAGFTSGGGFSQINSVPDYQKDHIEAYLNSGVELPPESYFNRNGRAYPDVSALGHNFLCFIGGQPMPVGGTSAATPAIAGMLALLNSELLKNGGKPIGFANPLLYKMHSESPESFNDVVKGDNICTEDGCSASCKGFKASAGWDPVTGLGSPNFHAWMLYAKLQDRDFQHIAIA